MRQEFPDARGFSIENATEAASVGSTLETGGSSISRKEDEMMCRR